MRIACICIVLLLGALTAVWGVGTVLSHHARRDIGDIPADLPFVSVNIAGAEKQVISGW